MEFSCQLLRVTVAQICRKLGLHRIQSIPLAILTEVLERYIKELAKQSHRYCELFGRTQPTLDDVGLAFQDHNVSLSELSDYVRNMDVAVFALDVPQFPFMPKDIVEREEDIGGQAEGTSSSAELETSVFVHKSLDDGLTLDGEQLANGTKSVGQHGQNTHLPDKRPFGLVQEQNSSQTRKPRLLPDDYGHSQYEMRSFVRSESGHYHAMAPGKLPDAHGTLAPDSSVFSDSESVGQNRNLQKSPTKMLDILGNDRWQNISSIGSESDLRTPVDAKVVDGGDRSDDTTKESWVAIRRIPTPSNVARLPKVKSLKKSQKSDSVIDDDNPASGEAEFNPRETMVPTRSKQVTLTQPSTSPEMMPMHQSTEASVMDVELATSMERIQSYTDTIDAVVRDAMNQCQSSPLDEVSLTEHAEESDEKDKWGMVQEGKEERRRDMREALICDTIDEVIARSGLDISVSSPEGSNGEAPSAAANDGFFDFEHEPVNKILEACSVSIAANGRDEQIEVTTEDQIKSSPLTIVTPYEALVRPNQESLGTEPIISTHEHPVNDVLVEEIIKDKQDMRKKKKVPTATLR